VLLPFTTETRQFALDRALVYAALLAVGVAGLLLAVVDVVGGEEEYSLMPLDAPGLWLAVVAMAVTTWGVLELIAEPPPPP
jgi:hypothetical protein